MSPQIFQFQNSNFWGIKREKKENPISWPYRVTPKESLALECANEQMAFAQLLQMVCVHQQTLGIIQHLLCRLGHWVLPLLNLLLHPMGKYHCDIIALFSPHILLLGCQWLGK